MKRALIKLFLVSIIFIFLLSGVYAVAEGTCDIVTRSECDNPATEGYIVMGLSSSTNAHGELASEGNYNYVLCCNVGTGSTSCLGTPSNKIIGLSSVTNAHAEVPDGTIYSNNICYENFQCSETTGSCESGETEILSLSSLTNAHIGGPGDYSVKICCSGAVTAGSCLLSSAQWNLAEAVEVQKVYLQVTGSGSECDGLAVSFKVIEGGIFSQGDATTQPVNVSFNGSSATSIWNAEWVDDVGTDPEYYFITSLINSPSMQLQSSDPKLKVTQQETDYCTNPPITTCEDYTDDNACSSDSCDIAEDISFENVNCEDENIYCGCLWDSENEICDSTWIEITEEDCGDASTGCNYGCTLCHDSLLEIDYCSLSSSCPSGDEPLSNGDGICDTGEGCLSEDCNDGDRDSCEDPFYCVEGKCSSVEGPPLSLGSCKVSQETLSECDEAPVGTKILQVIGTWTGEGTCGTSCQKCNDINEEIPVPCPAQIQLPFFGLHSVIITIIVIAGIYIFSIFKGKKNSKKK